MGHIIFTWPFQSWQAHGVLAVPFDCRRPTYHLVPSTYSHKGQEWFIDPTTTMAMAGADQLISGDGQFRQATRLAWQLKCWSLTSDTIISGPSQYWMGLPARWLENTELARSSGQDLGSLSFSKIKSKMGIQAGQKTMECGVGSLGTWEWSSS